MAGPGRELAIVHLVQDAAHGRFRDHDLELFPDPLDQIDQPPAHHAMDSRDRSRFDQLAKGTAMLVLQTGRLAGRLAVEQARRPIGVEPDHPVPDDLQPYAAHLGRLGARAPGVDRRQRQKSASLIGILAIARQPPKAGSIEVQTKRNRQRHGEPPWFATVIQTFADSGIPYVTLNESQSARIGIMPDLEHIGCQRALILADADSALDHVFFPDSGVVSVLAVYSDGKTIEMATIGREGVAGVQAVFGAKNSSALLLVQIPGSAAKMSRVAVMVAMGAMPSFRSLMYAYVEAFLEQVMVSVACNGAHSVKERLARWLLMMRDRSDDDELLITQSLLAEMLGVQRPIITNAAAELESAGFIVRGRRQVTILDRRGLMRASCECYQLVRERIALHLPKTYT